MYEGSGRDLRRKREMYLIKFMFSLLGIVDCGFISIVPKVTRSY